MCVMIPGRLMGSLGQGSQHHCIHGMVPGDRGSKEEMGRLAQGPRRSHSLSWTGCPGVTLQVAGEMSLGPPPVPLLLSVLLPLSL